LDIYQIILDWSVEDFGREIYDDDVLPALTGLMVFVGAAASDKLELYIEVTVSSGTFIWHLAT
jgi:hypothetical protein